MTIAKDDRMLLRELAGKVAEIAAEPIQAQKRQEWIKHNRMEHVAPRVLLFPDNAWTEFLPLESMKIADPFLRDVEYMLKQKIYHWEHFHDDYVFEPALRIPVVYDSHRDWGLGIKRSYSAEKNGSYGFVPTLNSEEDLEKMMSLKHEWTFDDAETARRVNLLQEIFGDILKVDSYIPYYTSSIIFDLINLRGLTQMMLDFYDHPEFFHKVMKFMSDSMLEVFRKIEQDGRLTLNSCDQVIPSGSVGYSAELPQDGFDGKHVRLKDLWGFADTQEFTDVSPAMWREFALPYQINLLKEFGLVYYGCCEKIDKKLDDILTIPNIRKISVSPWSDIRIAAEKIGRKCIYCRKPNPVQVIFNFDPGAVKRDLEELLKVAGECNLEIVLKDTHTCNGHPENFEKWVDLAQSLCK